MVFPRAAQSSRLAECVDVIIVGFLKELVQFSLINCNPSLDHFSLIWKNGSQQKPIFLDCTHFFSAKHFQLLMTSAQKCALLDYCVFRFLCDVTCLSSQMHAPLLSLSHWNIVHFQLWTSSAFTAAPLQDNHRIFLCVIKVSVPLSLAGFRRWWFAVHHQGDYDPHGQLHVSRRWIWATFSNPHSSSERLVAAGRKYQSNLCLKL